MGISNLNRLYLIKTNLRNIATEMREYAVINCFADADRIIAMEQQVARMEEILDEMRGEGNGK